MTGNGSSEEIAELKARLARLESSTTPRRSTVPLT
jgi:hypothetical protein